MSKMSIEGIRVDTEKATHHWTLSWLDDRSNPHPGDVYVSSTGQWYVYTPSQWGNRHSWTLSDAATVLDEYDRYLDDTKKGQIAEVAGLIFD